MSTLLDSHEFQGILNMEVEGSEEDDQEPLAPADRMIDVEYDDQF